MRSRKSRAALLIVTLSLATGCHKVRRASMPPVLPPAPSAVPPPSPDTIVQSQIRAQVRQVTAMLARLPNSPQNSVPDAVLNGAQCLIVAPTPSGAWRHATGLISCRAGDRWTPPGFLVLSLAGRRDTAATDLLWIANPQGAQAIRQNALRRARFQPGPLALESPLVAPTQLTAGILSYAYRNGRLMSSTVSIGAARPDRAATNAFYGRSSNIAPGQKAAEDLRGEPQRFVYAATSFFDTITPVGILIHHSGLIPIKVAAQLKEQVADMIDEFHARRGFEIICFGRVYHVGYHYLILPNGKVETGRPERCEGAHARGYNSFIGIALVGDFSPASNPSGLYGPSTPTRAQMRSLIKLCRRLRQRYHIPLQRVMRHSDVTSTYCPGSRFPIQALLRALERGGAS